MQIFNKIDQLEIREILFQPAVGGVPSCPQEAEDVSFEVDQDVSLTCRFYLSANDAPTLLYFYGGNESISSVEGIATGYNRCGVNVLVVSYRGYDLSTGTPSVETMFEDTKKLCSLIPDWLSQKNYSGSLFVLGRSLGSVCAMEVVLNCDDLIKGMIIESGFSSTLQYLAALGIDTDKLEITEDDGFNIIAKIEQIEIPTMILHGARDHLVAIDQAEDLQAFCGARSKQFFVIPGAERDTFVETAGPLYFQTMKKFIDTICGVHTWRRKRKSFKDKQEE